MKRACVFAPQIDFFVLVMHGKLDGCTYILSVMLDRRANVERTLDSLVRAAAFDQAGSRPAS
jgi:hypothetical protein